MKLYVVLATKLGKYKMIYSISISPADLTSHQVGGGWS